MTEQPGQKDVLIYLRPGCGFCARLVSDLRRDGVAFDTIDIWDHPEAAAFVRQYARGNETVPTVAVAGEVLVNPPASVVKALATASA